MANTFVKIATITASSPVNVVSFTGIPQTYTDLKLCVSARATTNSANQGVYLQFSADGNTVYSQTVLRSDGSSVSSFRVSASNAITTNEIPNTLNTTATFSNTEFYIPGYAGSTNKQIIVDGVKESNATTTAIQLYQKAALWRNTAAITSISIGTDIAAPNYDGSSTFTLYGIKNTA